MCATMFGWWTAEVAGVERVVAFLHEREQVCGARGVVGRGSHEASFSSWVMTVGLADHVGERGGRPFEQLLEVLTVGLEVTARNRGVECGHEAGRVRLPSES